MCTHKPKRAQCTATMLREALTSTPFEYHPPLAALFRLRVAEFPDGSRIYADSRGLLHLVSGDAELPEVTLVSPAGREAEITGWCSDGTCFGDSPFHFATVRGTRSSRSVFNRVIYPFMRHIIRLICPLGH